MRTTHVVAPDVAAPRRLWLCVGLAALIVPSVAAASVAAAPLAAAAASRPSGKASASNGDARHSSALVRALACHASWTIQGTSSSGQLFGLAAPSRTDVWAVGDAVVGTRTETSVERYEGAAWRKVTSPDPNGVFDELHGVAAAGASDAWAVGGQGVISGSTDRTLVEHWNGHAWSVVASPNPSVAGNVLDGVAAVSARDVWAVGDDDVTSANGPAHTLALHFDGRSWSAVASPDPGAFNALDGVTVVPGGSRLWAVGMKRTGSVDYPLVERWNGSRWSVVATPAVAGGWLHGVTAVSPDDAYAVGTVGKAPLMLRWNGSKWSRVHLPPFTGGLSGVAARSSGDVVSVGERLILQGSRASWMVVSWPRPAGGERDAVAVSSSPAGSRTWVAGSSSRGALVLGSCG